MSRPVDATRGPLLGVVVRLAAPVVAAMLCHSLFHVVDVMWVGRLGASATAAVTTSVFALWFLLSLGDVAATGIAATVARHVGAGERDRAGYAAAQGLWLALVLSLALAAVGPPLVEPLFRVVGAAPDVVSQASFYLRILLFGAPTTFLYFASESTMRAAGDTRTPMLIVVTSLALNAALDPFLIFGWGPFPRMGVAGAAVATVLSQALMVVWFLSLAARRHPGFPLDFVALKRFSPSYALRLARIGVPFCMIGILFSVVYLFLAQVTARFGTASLAVLGVGNRIESIGYLVAVGFAMASETLVGQNLGAHRPERAERAAWLTGGLMAAIAAVLSVVMWCWPAGLFSIFTPDREVIRLGVPYLRVLAACQVFSALEIVLNASFSGAGDTVPPMLISTTISVVRIPVAWSLAVGLRLGLLGIAWTITSSSVLRSCLLALWFRRGAWKTKALATAGPPALHAPAAEPPI